MSSEESDRFGMGNENNVHHCPLATYMYDEAWGVSIDHEPLPHLLNKLISLIPKESFPFICSNEVLEEWAPSTLCLNLAGL